ncbi:MAG: SPFH domain-containing protein, partial [Myxococcota bacterium]|nr:SPFH domain-containing protein [Myxococcota bacterium]
QESSFLSLTPLTISIPLRNALSLQNIRIHVPSTFTVGVSTDEVIMQNAAERLLHLNPSQIEEMSQEIIFGQLRLTVASLTIEQINQDREKFLAEIRRNVEPELNKIGLNLINVNITDINDESDYIESIGKKAASEAVNRAMVDVAEQDKIGAIGRSIADRQREIEVRQNLAQSIQGQKEAEAGERIFVEQQESAATIGEANANKTKDIKVAEASAEAAKGKKAAEADRRVYVQGKEAEAITGENEAKAKIAEVNAELATREASARQRGEVAQRLAQVAIEQAQYKSELERLTAGEVVTKEVEKRIVEITASATAERVRLEAQGEADATLMKYEAEAKGVQQVLDAKAKGYEALVASCDGDARSAATLLMIEKIENIVDSQVEAIKNLKIDKITVWDSGSGAGGKGSSTANFMSSMIKALPPLQEVAAMAGVELPDYLGKIKDELPLDEPVEVEEAQ